jgi:hypothetical protein
VVQLQLTIADFDLMPHPAAWRTFNAAAGLQAALAARVDWQVPLRATLERRFAATRRAAVRLPAAAGAPMGAARAAGPHRSVSTQRMGTGARGVMGMAPRPRACPRDAALAAQRRLLFARQRVMWAALRHSAVNLTPGWVARCVLLLQPLIPALNARVAAALLQAAAAARPLALLEETMPALVDRAVECCTFTRGPLLLKLLQALDAAIEAPGAAYCAPTSGDDTPSAAEAASATSTARPDPSIALAPDQQRLLAMSVLRGCSDLSPAQAARALGFLRHMGVLPRDAGAAWLRWLCGAVEAALVRMQPRHVAAAVGVLTAAACAAGSGPSGDASAGGGGSGQHGRGAAARPARLLAPVLHAALAQLASTGANAAAHGLGSQRLALLLVALGLIQQQAPQQRGQRVHGAADTSHGALARALLLRLDGQLAEAAGRSGGRAASGLRRRRPWQPSFCSVAAAPALPGALLLQLSASLPALPVRPPRRVAAALARRVALLSVCSLAPPGLVRSLWARELAAELRAVAAGAAECAVVASAAAKAKRAAAGLRARAAALVAAPPLPLGAVRRLRTGARSAAVRRQLAQLADGLAPDHTLPGQGASNAGQQLAPLALLRSGSAGCVDSPASILVGLPPGASLPGVLSSLLELRFARLVQTVVGRGGASSDGDAVGRMAEGAPAV